MITTQIVITQQNDDKTNYLKLVVKLLNERFTTQESMEQRWELNCTEIAQELNSSLIVHKRFVQFWFGCNIQ